MGLAEHRPVRNTIDIVILAAENKELINERSIAKKGLQVLLVKRDIEPYIGMWTLPGGFVSFDKKLSESVKEKLKQKTGIDNMYTEQLYTYGEDINRDPRDRVISIGYIALTTKNRVQLQNCHGNNETAWFWIDTQRGSYGEVLDITLHRSDTESLEKIDKLGFDHKMIIIDAINRISNKIMYTDIGFNLVNNEFTITELQSAYEAIVGRSIPGFRRIIAPKVIETGKSTSDFSHKKELHRPSKLFTHK